MTGWPSLPSGGSRAGAARSRSTRRAAGQALSQVHPGGAGAQALLAPLGWSSGDVLGRQVGDVGASVTSSDDRSAADYAGDSRGTPPRCWNPTAPACPAGAEAAEGKGPRRGSTALILVLSPRRGGLSRRMRCPRRCCSWWPGWCFVRPRRARLRLGPDVVLASSCRRCCSPRPWQSSVSIPAQPAADRRCCRSDCAVHHARGRVRVHAVAGHAAGGGVDAGRGRLPPDAVAATAVGRTARAAAAGDHHSGRGEPDERRDRPRPRTGSRWRGASVGGCSMWQGRRSSSSRPSAAS